MATRPRVPWHEYGVMLREIAVGNPVLIEIGLWLPGARVRRGYFHGLETVRLIRLKTTAEIMAAGS